MPHTEGTTSAQGPILVVLHTRDVHGNGNPMGFPWESHGNGNINTLNMGMGMGIVGVTMGMGMANFNFCPKFPSIRPLITIV